MVDINPAALSRPSIGLSTPSFPGKSGSINVSVPSSASASASASSAHSKPQKTSLVPPRIDLEPIYTALKAAIGAEQWPVYKETLTNFLIGRLNQAELSERIDPILASQDGQKEHLHNQLIAAIYANVTREMPDPGLAPWVSANDKPTTAQTKPVTGDANERRLKGEVMQLPARDRRRIKELAHNDFDPYDALANVLMEHARAKPPKIAEPPASAGGLKMNFDLEIRKRYAQPLAVESGEFPDTSNIESRMLPFCYEAGLSSGHAPDAAQFMSIATETFIKEVMSAIFSRTRSNGPGDSGSAGFGLGSGWIQTHRYRKQLAKEEEAFQRGEISRDKMGLLPVEAKAASERGPLGMADVRLALEMGDCGLAGFPVIVKSVIYGWREGELENWEDYTYVDPSRPDGIAIPSRGDGDVEMGGVGVNGVVKGEPEPQQQPLANGVHDVDAMDIDGVSVAGGAANEIWWEGAEPETSDLLNAVLDSCLAVN